MFGPALREQALDMFEEHRSDWLSQARLVAAELGRHGALITVNMVRQRCPPPADIDPRVMGAIFRAPVWVAAGFVQSNRKTCHARPIRQFRMRGQ